MLSRARSAAELEALSGAGQVLADRLASSKRPVVAAIHGACMGGGLEIALACSYRVGSASDKTRLSVPEVMLGLLPGAGGTQRLPRLVGLQTAIKMMTTGAPMRPDKARKAGLLDEVVDPTALRSAAVAAARELAAGTLRRPVRPVSWLDWLLEGNPVGRAILFSQAAKAVASVARGHYPAPLAILDVVRAGVDGGISAGLAAERRAFGVLGMTPVSAALRGIFFAQTASKRVQGTPPAAGALVARPVAVLGAGLMGAGIATVTAGAGLRVVLKDRDAASLARGAAQQAAVLEPRVRKRRLTAFARDVQLSRVTGVSDTDPSWRAHIGRCGIVVEAVPEELELKHRVLRSIEPLLPADAVFATNTSALPIASIAAAAARPERVIGMHYFSPVDKMPLLELIPHEGTCAAALGTAYALGLAQGKTVIVVKDVPGFYVNRCLGPWAAEALYLVQQGADPVALDAAVRNFGYPMGPVQLADEVGVDILAHTYSTIAGAIGPRMGGASNEWMKEMVAGKMLGRKTGRGFYLYDPVNTKGSSSSKKQRQINPDAAALLAKYRGAAGGGVTEPAIATTALPELAERMVLRFVKECMHSLEAGIIRSPADGDLGAVFGLGFPPFLGGPFRYVDQQGAAKVEAKMARLADKLGERFAPPDSLRDLVKSGKTFHGPAA